MRRVFITGFQLVFVSLALVWLVGAMLAALGSDPLDRWSLVYVTLGVSGFAILMMLAWLASVRLTPTHIYCGPKQRYGRHEILDVDVRYVGETDFLFFWTLPTIAPFLKLDKAEIEIENLAGYASERCGGHRVLRQARTIRRWATGDESNIPRPSVGVARPRRGLS